MTTNAVTVGNGTPRVEQYGYDNLYRLTTVNYGDGGVQGYTFDNMGNRLTRVSNGVPTSYSYNAANMLLSRDADAYLNDANGNTLSGGGRLNTWDSQNRLVKCVSGSNTSLFTYGSDGLRRTSVVNGTTTHYALDNGMLVREFSATLQPTATYLPGPRGVEYRRNDATGQTVWYLYDGLGSVLAEIDPLGNMTTPRKYDVYGAVRSGDAGSSKHKFVGSLGHTSEDETGLIYVRARWMDPALGRFISEDPARDGSNWFEYCRGNPVNAVDPDGRVWTGPLFLFYFLTAICMLMIPYVGAPAIIAFAVLVVVDIVLTILWIQQDIKPALERLKRGQMNAGLSSISGDQLDRVTGAIATIKGATGPGVFALKVMGAQLEQALWLSLAEG